MIKKIIFLLMFFVFSFVSFSNVNATTDVKPNEPKIFMMKSNSCSYCNLFLDQFLPKYQNFQEWVSSDSSNLKKTDIPDIMIFELPPDGELPKWFKEEQEKKTIPGIVVIPTFFYWDGEKVGGYIEGYLNPYRFSHDLYELVIKVKEGRNEGI